MVHGLLESTKRTVKLWPLEFKIEWVTVSATFCTATSKVVNGPLSKVCLVHNTFHKISKTVEILLYILDTYQNANIFYSGAITISMLH